MAARESLRMELNARDEGQHANECKEVNWFLQKLERELEGGQWGFGVIRKVGSVGWWARTESSDHDAEIMLEIDAVCPHFKHWEPIELYRLTRSGHPGHRLKASTVQFHLCDQIEEFLQEDSWNDGLAPLLLDAFHFMISGEKIQISKSSEELEASNVRVQGIPVVVDLKSDWGRTSVDITPVIPLRNIQGSGPIRGFVWRNLDEHNWLSHATKQKLVNNLTVAPQGDDWRIGCPIGDRMILQDLANRGGCEVEVYKVLKTVNSSNWTTTNFRLPSYCLLTTLYEELRRCPSRGAWDEERLPTRIKEAIKTLLQALRKPHEPIVEDFYGKNPLKTQVEYSMESNPEDLEKFIQRVEVTLRGM